MNTQAFLTHVHSIHRDDFIPEPFKCEARLNVPLPIGYGQTISQPSLVLEMSLLLNPEAHHKVLEIGTGSGYQSVLLAPFCKSLYTIERIPELAHLAQQRFHSMKFDTIHVHIGDGSLGWPEEAPFDRIIVTAGCSKIPPELIKQVAKNGRLLIPVGEPHSQHLLLIEKDVNDKLTTHDVGKVVFVELVGDYGWRSNHDQHS